MIETIARGVIVREGCLLVCRTKGASNTYLPGGHIEFGERAADSLRREIMEELGVPAPVGRMLGAVEHTFMQKGRKHCEINIIFEAEADGLDASRAPESREGYIEFRWIPLSRLAESDLEPGPLRKLIPAWLEGGRGAGIWASTY